MPPVISSSSSTTFRLFLAGTRTSFTPTVLAAKSFSFKPPIGRTFPRRVISPVIAISPRTGMPVIAERMASAIVIPADGPSFGTAPSGICR